MAKDSVTTRIHPAAWVPTMYFAEGLPFFAISLIAGILYKRLGLPNDVIALYTSWLLLPWSLKPIWSPLLEMFKTKKFFVVFFEFAGGLSLASIALCLPLLAALAVMSGAHVALAALGVSTTLIDGALPIVGALALICVAPIMALGWFCQKQLVQGMTFGAVK